MVILDNQISVFQKHIKQHVNSVCVCIPNSTCMLKKNDTCLYFIEIHTLYIYIQIIKFS